MKANKKRLARKKHREYLLKKGEKMKNKKLGIALLTLAVFTSIQTKNEKRSREGLYQPASTDAVIIVPGIEDAVVGAGSTVAEIVTLGHANTGNAPTGLLVAVPDVFGAAKARKDSNSDKSCSSKMKMKKECKKEKPAKVKKEKSCKKPCDSKTKSTRTRKEKADDAGKVITAPVVVPGAMAADVITLDTQNFTTRAVDSINDDSETEYAAE
jgi:hypothetical protein